ncbi:MAG TPA: glutamine--fructose-6-phosphate transaminase (isomerizing) [Vitreimonas sp.]|nr:glutamine--fructose-6-phosphate transaminase (isomerizing) [Vitreimonas sp.]
MCGIFMAQGSDAGQQVLQGLKRLEYRGYDSWGVSVLKDGQLQIDKHTGKIGGVDRVQLPSAEIALGHTRWATHGGVTETNAHPHLASDGSFALVQNGVVENYQELKAVLIAEGYEFISQTDTEVIVHLLESERRTAGAQELNLDIIKKALSQLAGRSTVGVLTTTGVVYAFRFGSPLIVGKSEQGHLFLSSDVLSLSEVANQYYSVNNGQIIRIEGEKAEVTELSDHTLQPVTFVAIDVESMKLDKAGYDHFMLKEIHEQPQAYTQILTGQETQLETLAAKIIQARHVYTVGAGSASFAAGQIAFYLRQQGVLATELKSYEAKSYHSFAGTGDLCLAISQSGETADTNEVIEWMKEQGVTIASLVNMSGSTLTALSDVPCMLQVGPEVGVASTKALTGQMVWGAALAHVVAGRSVAEAKTLIAEFAEQLSSWLQTEEVMPLLHTLAIQLVTHQHLFILGRGQLYYPALEFALKMKEISYIHAEGFSGGELKHGVIALIEKGTPVVCLITNDDEQADMLSAAAEVKARGARVIGISPEPNELFETWIQVPHSAEFAAVTSVIPSQFLTYFMALEKGLDPDKPRNLAKSVTVK